MWARESHASLCPRFSICAISSWSTIVAGELRDSITLHRTAFWPTRLGATFRKRLLGIGRDKNQSSRCHHRLLAHTVRISAVGIAAFERHVLCFTRKVCGVQASPSFSSAFILEYAYPCQLRYDGQYFTRQNCSTRWRCASVGNRIKSSSVTKTYKT